MKKPNYFKRILQFFIVFLVLILAAPYAVHLSPVRHLISAKIGAVVKGDLKIQNISWSWLPSPAINLSGIQLSGSPVDAGVDHASAGIGFSGLLSGAPAISLELFHPDIILKSFKISPETKKTVFAEHKKPRPFSIITVTVKNGHIRLPSDGPLTKLDGHTPPLDVFDLNAKISATPDTLDIRSLCRLTFIKQLNANIRFKRKKAESSATGNQKTYWDLDISGRNINLSEANEKVMRLFGEHQVAEEVCGIVRGGTAKSGRYRFHGYTEDFNDLANMTITAEAKNAIIDVPDVDLHLEDANGPIKIENAVLTGQHLAATLGHSYAKNSSIRLGLAGDKQDFNLAMDLDADASELPDLLRHHLLKHHPRVVDELGRISHAEGRATVRLEIVDKLKDVAVNVMVSDSDSRISYQRLKYPVEFARGTLEFSHDRCVWRDVAGTVGPHEITDTHGSVSWSNGISLDVENVDADVQAGDLLDELTSWPALEQKLAPLVRSADGQVNITDLKVHGPVKNFKDLDYSADLAVKQLGIDTPLLPGKAYIKDLRAKIENRKAILSQATIAINNQRLDVTADLTHNNWKAFTGRLEFKGNIEKNLADWVKQKNWIPSLYFPAVPCRVEPLTITFSHDETAVSGNLVTPLDDKKITTRFDLDIKPDKIDLKNLTVESLKEKASLWLSVDRTCEPNLDLGFTGSISQQALSSILEDNRLLSGQISGDFKLTHFFDQPGNDRCEGTLNISDFTIPANGSHIHIKQAEISGHESFIKFKQVLLRLNDEALFVDGQAMLSGNGINTEMTIRSNYLSADNILQTYHSLTGENGDVPSKEKNPSDNCPVPATSLFGLPVTGDIDFDFKQFAYSPPAAETTSEKKPLVWEEASGIITLTPENDITVSVLNAAICGIKTTGTWTRSSEEFVINIAKDTKDKIDLEQFFSCIGKKNVLFTGRCNVSLTMTGSPCHWKSGHLEFYSRNGVIANNIQVLSKIFTLINVTELFSVNNIRQIFSKGYPYSKMKISADIVDNQLMLDEAYIIGNGLDFFIKGTIDVCSNALDLMVYVKPFKTIDSLVSVIPLLDWNDFGNGKGSIVVIPVKVTGDIKNQDVSFYKGKFLDRDKHYLHNLIKKTISLPSKVLDAVTPE